VSAQVPNNRQLQPANIPSDFGGLSTRQLKFVEHYLETSNATQSARYAGYNGDDATLAVTGTRLIRLAKVQMELRRRLGIAVAGPGEVLELLSKHARADLTDVLDVNTGEFNLKKARRKRLLKKLRTKKTVRYTRDGERIEETHTEYEIHDPQVALEKLGRFHQLFPTKVEISADDLDAAINAAIQAHSLPVIDVTPSSEQGLQSSLDQLAPLDHADGPVDQVDHD
jgi:phage terminase small subunit